jgi:hypothetical protein
MATGWAAYTHAMVDSKLCSGAGVYGHDGNPWAQTPSADDVKKNAQKYSLTPTGFTATAAEVKTFIAALKGGDAGIQGIQASGIKLGGVKYMALDCSGGVLRGKHGEAGIAITLTGKT